jgi:hypothetical protein
MDSDQPTSGESENDRLLMAMLAFRSEGRDVDGTQSMAWDIFEEGPGSGNMGGSFSL